ncbi:MAG: lytic transglycosylase domain-containing protein [Acidobacteria bacterium]|nr:lytic transglycosylase domain-containing protein [Acidobacteriota bacterium]
MPTRVLLLALGAALTWPTLASAQIYVWRDAGGTLVLSDQQPAGESVTYAVPNAPAFRVTRPTTSGAAHEPFEPLLQEYAARHGLRPGLVRAIIQVESGFDPGATSPKGAMGLMQLMPATALALGVRRPYDPTENIRGGTAYLRQLLDRYDGDEVLALAAYNAGSGTVDRYGGQVPPYRETRDYVRKVGSAEVEVGLVDAPRPGKRTVYKSLDIIDGEPVVRYSTERPESGAYQIVDP